MFLVYCKFINQPVKCNKIEAELEHFETLIIKTESDIKKAMEESYELYLEGCTGIDKYMTTFTSHVVKIEII